MADLDPSEYTIDALADELDDIDDAETLREIRDAETDGENRAGAVEAIDDCLETVSNQTESGDGGDDTSESSGTSGGILAVRNRVRDAAADLIGRPLDSIIEVERTDDGWRALVEIVERSSVPDTQDILGRYAIELDGSEITGYRRLNRYRRGDTRSDEPAEAPR